MYAGYFFRLLSLGKVGKRGDRRHPLGPLGPRDPSSYLEYSPVKLRKRYQSHFEALGLHLFVRDAERCSDDCANSSNPTYSKGCTQSTQNTHTHTHTCTPRSICFLPQLWCLRRLQSWSLDCGSLRPWLWKRLQLCRKLGKKMKLFGLE